MVGGGRPLLPEISGQQAAVEATAWDHIGLHRTRAVLSNGPAGLGPRAPKPQGPPNSPCV